MIPVCTTMNKRIYERYGHVMIDTWLKFWSDDFHLYIWCEDECNIPKHTKITIMPWNNVNNHWMQFKNKVTGLNEDEYRFAKKAFVTIDSFEKFNTGFYIWLDADTESRQAINKETFSSLFDGKYLINLFDVSKVRSPQFTAVAAESGFVVINLDHDKWPQMKEDIRIPWLTGIKPPIESWFDGEVLRYASLQVDESMVNLLDKYADKNGKKVKDRPWDYTWLANYVVHHKGNKAKNRRFRI